MSVCRLGLYDPLWLLARQWQLGEFQGEDNGSPIMASWRAEQAKSTRCRSGPIKPNTITSAPTFDAKLMPLESLVVDAKLSGPRSINRRDRRS